ncbi:MAG: hypothetical protein ACOC2H_09025, partial [Spirochaetota bacterium]
MILYERTQQNGTQYTPYTGSRRVQEDRSPLQTKLPEVLLFGSHVTAAVFLSNILLHEISTSSVSINSDGTTDPTFFDHVYHTYYHSFCSSFHMESESFDVHTRQMMILLKRSETVLASNGVYSLSPSIIMAAVQKPTFLFDTFWNRVQWSALFPSMPSVAEQMFAERYELVSLVLEYGHSFFLDEFARDFLIVSGIQMR